MEIRKNGSPFGSGTRTRVLMVLRLLGSSFPRELARLLELSPSVAQKALASLERDGLISGRLVGRTRSYTLNPRYFARKELEAFVLRLTEADAGLRQRTEQLRRRPRRAGKTL
jgi:DNA-binding transcriptional ArsR family regulator